jgi:hypothetical protein
MYYVLDRGVQPGRWIGESPRPVDGVSFRTGRVITRAVPDPLEFTLKPMNARSADHGPAMPSYLKARSPLFRDDLVDAMRACGVDNLDVYEAIISDPDSGERRRDYKAINIIGLVAAADMARSTATVHPGGPLIDVDFDDLVVDEAKAQGLLLFRLAESTNGILVHERLKRFLLAKGFDDLAFHDPREVAL